jgi:3-oxoacyl-[acyl-carrier protein] reductase
VDPAPLGERVALVTGGAGGIGAAVAGALADRGARVAILDRAEADGASVAARIKDESGGVETMSVDGSVTDSADVADALQAVNDRFGPVDIVVNVAGVPGTPGRVADISDDEWALVIGTHLTGTFHLVRAAIPSMIDRRWGRIVNITSTAAWNPGPGISPYAAAKAGITGFSRSVAAEVGRFGVTVNCVSPGLVATDKVRSMWSDPAELADQAKRLGIVVPGPRLGEPSEIAEAVAYLCGEGSSFTTGTTIHVNGGSYM